MTSSSPGSPTPGAADTETVSDTRLYGTALARSWDRLHPKLTHRSSWTAADGTLPIVEGMISDPAGSRPLEWCIDGHSVIHFQAMW